MSRRVRVVATAMACAMITACGAEGAGSTESSAAAGEVDSSATVRFSYGAGASTLDPHLSSSSYEVAVLDLVYDRLVSVNAAGELVPGLAESWSYTADGSSLTLMLRQGVTFHDGTPFTAEVVKGNLERARTLEGSKAAGDLERVESVEVRGEHEVRIGLSEPDAALVGALSRATGMMISPAAFDKDLTREAAGSGPYRITQYRPNSRIMLERFEEHWDEAAAPAASLEYEVQVDDTTRLNALRAGEIDLTVLQEPQIEGAERAGLTLDIQSTQGFVHLQPNRGRAFFADARVRRALSLAIDRDAIVRGVGFGHGTPSYQLFPEGSPAHDPGVEPDAHAPDEAKRLLAQAGYEGLKFETITPTTHQSYAVAVQGQLAEIGVDMKVRVVPNTQVIDTFYVQQQGDAIITPVGPRPDPSQMFETFFAEDSVLNVGGNTPPETEGLLADARETVDEKQRVEAFHRMARLVAGKTLTIPLVHPVTVVATSDQVVGAQVQQLVVPVLRGVGLRAG